MDKLERLKVLGEHLKSIRKQKGLTQTELANIMGRDHPSINRLEKGRINPSFIFLEELSEAMGMSIQELLNELSSHK